MSNLLNIHRQHQNGRDSFAINALQWLQDHDGPGNGQLHTNHQYEIIWVITGSLNHCIDLKETFSEGPRLFLTRPGQVHCFSLYENTRGYHIRFTEAFLDMEDQVSDTTYYNSLFRLFSASDCLSIDDKLATDLDEIMQRMVMEYTNNHSFRTEILKRYFKIFLIYLTRLFEDNFFETKYNRNTELLQKFMCSLEKKYKTQKMVSEYAFELHVTPNYLNEIIKKMTGFSASFHIRNRVILEAKRLCRYSDHCMKEIAYHLGFSDSAHFSKFFKSITGTNFSEFKKDQILLLPAA